MKSTDEVMCASLHRRNGKWSITLHGWDGFKGPLEHDSGEEISFPSADEAIAEASRLGFSVTALVAQGKPPSLLGSIKKDCFRLVVSPDCVITPAMSSSAVLALEF